MYVEDDQCQVELTAAQCEGVCQGSVGSEFLGINHEIDRIRELFAKTLTIREEEVLIARFGLFGAAPETLEELAVRLDVSAIRIQQLEARAIRKLRAAIVNKKGG